MDNEPTGEPDTASLTLRFVGEDDDGNDLHELRAAHVAEVLQGLVGITSDFAKAGAFGDGPVSPEVLVRPPREGSFVIEVIRAAIDDPGAIATAATVAGVPTLSQVIWWATRSVRADVENFEHLENDMVKVIWQDDTAQEIPRAAWNELQKNDRRRKKQLRQILAPLSDENVTSLEVAAPEAVETRTPEQDEPDEAPTAFTLDRTDYDAVRPDTDIQERAKVFETEAQMSAIDFDDPERWRVKVPDRSARSATVEDKDFLLRVDRGLAIHKRDLFNLKIREDAVTKNGRTRRKWTVLQVLSHRRSVGDDDT